MDALRRCSELRIGSVIALAYAVRRFVWLDFDKAGRNAQQKKLFSNIVHDSARLPYTNTLKRRVPWGKRGLRSDFIRLGTPPVALETVPSAFFGERRLWAASFSTRHFELDLT